MKCPRSAYVIAPRDLDRERLACQAVASQRLSDITAWPAFVLLRRGSHRSCCAASEGWRRGELNPCPRRSPRKHLHAYPTINSEEPSHAPAHCRLPSVHEFPSPSDAVAPPFD